MWGDVQVGLVHLSNVWTRVRVMCSIGVWDRSDGMNKVTVRRDEEMDSWIDFVRRLPTTCPCPCP